MILRRLRGDCGPTDPNFYLAVNASSATHPPGYEDVRRSVLETMCRTTSFEWTPKTRKGSAPRTAPLAAAASGSVKGKGVKGAGKKRKRPKQESDESEDQEEEMSDLVDDDESDDAASVTTFPNITQSGRKVVKPAQFVPQAAPPPSKKRSSTQTRKIGKNVENALCKRCGRGHSPNSNMIVFCDGCNAGWHQMCHDPMVSNEMVKDVMKEWFCAECTAKRERKKERAFRHTTASTPSNGEKDVGWTAKSLDEVCPISLADQNQS